MHGDTMTDRLTPDRPIARTHDVHAGYLTSYRANAACVRELGRLYEAIVDGIEAWRSDLPDADRPAPPTVRRSPLRCLVQLGPVALTVAWLQHGQGTVADGELLVVVWRGVVASRTPRGFEREEDRAGASSATALWEGVLKVAAENESGWSWISAATPDEPASSAMLAERCVGHLRTAYAESTRAD